MIIQSENIQSTLTQSINKNLFDVILIERNRVLSSAITSSQYDKIYITYGLLHFDGVLKNLQKNDPKWQIISKKELFPIQ